MSKPKLLRVFDDKTTEVAYSKLNNQVTVSQSGETLSVDLPITVESNTMLTFKAPCDCTSVTSITISGKSYSLVDAKGTPLSSSRSFVSGSLVTVVLDTSSNKAYIQNAAFDIDIGDLHDHTVDLDNPHKVSKEQVGLGNVTNDAQVKKSEVGKSGGVASLGSDGKVPTNQLPAMDYAPTDHDHPDYESGINSVGNVATQALQAATSKASMTEVNAAIAAATSGFVTENQMNTAISEAIGSAIGGSY